MKYRNRPTNGYSSRKEANRAAELQALQRSGVISGLREQTEWILVPKQEGERAVKYRSDFDYRDEKGKLVVEDTKGFRTRDYVIKRKLMRFVHNIAVVEL